MTLLQFYSRLFLAFMALMLAACANTTRIDVESTQEFPSPLVVKTDVHMGIYVPEEFQRYVYEDYEKTGTRKKSRSSSTKGSDKAPSKSNSVGANDAQNREAPDKGRLKFRIDLGEAQARMVRSVFPGVFRKATLLDSVDISLMPEDLDLFMVPSIQKVQYTTPTTTRKNVYEIWLQYVFTIYDRNGDVMARWKVPSYGKTPTAMMKSKENALHTATQMALRDCGAAFSTGFQQQPSVARWLAGRELRRPNRTKPVNTQQPQEQQQANEADPIDAKPESAQ